ncbi:LysR family transcriptional regulator [Shouchella miscanthi]|uniref:LysR family transcriptional regulator n=1 Tax=Shouchella miscanthi TaxID=2598861 RepID=A0ABU6NKG6_9BACI|nr:LysR family transcriptional regulator [Shouchella miscanthi]
MKMDTYYIFYLTALELNFSRAAKRLFITQPSVSQSIAQLENHLQTQLFQRLSKGVSLTTEGKQLFEQIKPAFETIQLAEKTMSERAQLKQGFIAIGASDSACKHLLLPIVQSFQNKYPDVHLKLQNGSTPELLAKLQHGLIEIALVHLPIDEQRYSVEGTYSIHSAFVVGERYKHLTEKAKTLSQLAQYPIVTFSQQSQSRMYLNELFASHHLTVSPEVEVSAMDVLLACTKIGMGIAFVTKEFVQEPLNQQDIYEIPLTTQLKKRHIGIVTTKHAPLSYASQSFLSTLTNSFNNYK